MSENSETPVTTDGTSSEPPVDTEPTPTEPDPEPDPEPTPDPVTPGTITWEPATWYSITYACRTVGCPSENHVYSAPMFYSNDGNPAHIRVIDSVCGKDSAILTATKLDPQPIEE